MKPRTKSPRDHRFVEAEFLQLTARICNFCGAIRWMGKISTPDNGSNCHETNNTTYAEARVNAKVVKLCPACNGLGHVPATGRVSKCDVCFGNGVVSEETN